MGTITKAIDSIFNAGDVVTVTDAGATYSTYTQMATYLGLTEYVMGRNPLKRGDKVTVVSSAMHESSYYGEVVAVRTEDGKEFMIGARGISEPMEANGGPIVKGYKRAPLCNDPELKAVAANAPAWVLFVGRDGHGIHYFDHHPYLFNENSLLKGLLPRTHRMQMNNSKGGAVSALSVKDAFTKDQTIANLQRQLATQSRELAEVRAKLWEAEQKLVKVAEVLA